MSTASQRGRAILKRLARTGVDEPRMVEVGVWRGHLSAWLLTMHPTLTLCMVDRWDAVDEHHPYYRSGAQIATANHETHRAAMAEAMRLTDHATDRTVMYQMESVEAAARLETGSVDLVFIDADHSYEAVKSDMMAWWPVVKPGGWISGHDWDNQPVGADSGWGVREAVEELAGELKIELDDDKTWFVRKPYFQEVSYDITSTT